MKKILFIPPGIQGGWYVENHFEYLIRYLSDEFFIEMATLPYPPYKDFIHYPENSPFMRNPDDYDLLVPLLPSHWGVTEREKYQRKVACVLYEPGEGDWHRAKALAIANPVDTGDYGPRPTMRVQFGIDTNLFQPYPMKREDDLLHVGMVGTLNNPRRQFQEGVMPLFNIPGVRWMFFPGSWINQGDKDKLGGPEYVQRVVTGDRRWPGVPNMYNRLDVLVRIDNSYGISFPTLEAAACGVPVITTFQGIDHLITEAGGGITLYPEDREGVDNKRWPTNDQGELPEKLQKAIEYMRDHPRKRKEMGKAARAEIEKNWTWDKKKIDGWRKFLRKATQ